MHGFLRYFRFVRTCIHACSEEVHPRMGYSGSLGLVYMQRGKEIAFDITS